MRMVVTLPVFIFCAFASAQEPPPDGLFDRYRLEAGEAMAKGDNKRALEVFAKIEALDMEMPAELLYFYARALVEQGAEAESLKELEKGQSLLKWFVIRAGKDSEHYESALKLLSQAESSIEAARQNATPVAGRELARNPGRQFRDCVQCPEMIVVPAGEFIMGSPAGEDKRDDDEGPQRRVVIGKPFAVGKYEVTFAEWDACVKAGGCGRHRPADEGWGRGRRPVINVSWDAAQAYAEWLSRETGKSYRLLSESEWEYAARAGTKTRYYFGNEASQLCRWGNVADQSAKREYGDWTTADCNDGYVHTVPVGSYRANKFGLHDMHGNVSEWVADCLNENYLGAPNDGRAWKSGDCSRRILRGGSWCSRPRFLRSANRGKVGTDRSYYSGFRVARTL